MTPSRPVFWDKLPTVADYPVSEVENYDPNKYDFRWNDDYTRFIPVKLRWTDERSYVEYQGDNTWLDEVFAI